MAILKINKFHLRASHGRFSDKVSVVQFVPAHMLLIHLNRSQRAPVCKVIIKT